MKINVTVNGREYSHVVEPRLLLVHYLRDVLRLTGTHIGCDTSSCGSCTILVNGKTTKSCTLLAVQADDCEVVTIEGLEKDGEIHALQEGFKEMHGLQCGFCTPGMIMTAKELLEHNPHPSEEQIRYALEGNFCRCTGYHNILKSVQYAAEKMKKEVVV
ncbi:MAG: (2Fe-2S)-binding protein [Ginsengibacter sp.]